MRARARAAWAWGLAAALAAGGAGGCAKPAGEARVPVPGTTHARAASVAEPDADALRRTLGDEAAEPAARLRAADALERTGEPLGAGDRERIVRAADALAPGVLQPLWSALEGRGTAAAAVALRAAMWTRHRGDDAGALAWLERVRGDAELEGQGAALKVEILDRREVARRRIAVLLPLSGRHGPVGEEIRRGIELAAGGADDAELVFLDTAGDASRAAAAARDAVRTHRAAALIGPVGRGEAAAAARRAVALGVPIAHLSPSAAGGAPGAVYQLWSSPAWEARQAARLAAELRYERVGVLAPRSGGGSARARAFSDEAARLGIEVARRGGYDPTATDLEPDVRAFLQLDPSRNERLRRHLRRRGREGWKTFVPELDIELLYIPDRHDRAALVASYLPYFNVEVRTDPFMNAQALRDKYGQIPPVVQLLGSAGWRHPGLVPRGGRAVEGALVIAPCREPEALGSEGRAFFSAFEARHGREPGDVAAQAYDAARLVFDARRYAERQRPADLRAEIAHALSRMTIEDGACGPGRVRGAELAREPAVYEVTGGEIVPYYD